MQLNLKQRIPQLLKSLVLIIILKSVFGYIFDLVVNFDYAIQNANFLFAYLIMDALNSWLFLIAFVVYFIIFQKLTETRYLLFKVIFILIVTALYARYFYMDNFSLTIGKQKEFKLFITTVLSAMVVLLANEFLPSKKIKE